MPFQPLSPVLHSIDFRLSYGDCDPAGIIYFAAYYQWMERVYGEWTYLGEFQASVMRDLWGSTHISRASGCEYFVPAVLFDAVTCEMRVARVGDTSFTMAFDFIRRTDSTRLAQGHMVLVFIDEDTRPGPVPEGFKSILRAAGADW